MNQSERAEGSQISVLLFFCKVQLHCMTKTLSSSDKKSLTHASKTTIPPHHLNIEMDYCDKESIPPSIFLLGNGVQAPGGLWQLSENVFLHYWELRRREPRHRLPSQTPLPRQVMHGRPGAGSLIKHLSHKVRETWKEHSHGGLHSEAQAVSTQRHQKHMRDWLVDGNICGCA